VSDATPYNLADALDDYGLEADDIGAVYKHDTSTPANDPNENRLHQEIQQRLGRTEGNPLPIVSQKWLTGHPKGGAAAWQSIGLMQTFESGIIPGNRNLENVDPEMRQFSHLLFTDTNLKVPADRLRAGLVTSLGFGHVNALLLFIHPDAFVAALDEEERREWRASVTARKRASRESRASMMRGEESLLHVRTERRFEAPDGSKCQEREEVDTLLDASSRLDSNGRYVRRTAAE
jgi:acyl transferase domain-containing protein